MVWQRHAQADGVQRVRESGRGHPGARTTQQSLRHRQLALLVGQQPLVMVIG